MLEQSEQVLTDALTANVAHVTAASLRYPEPPSVLRGPPTPSAAPGRPVAELTRRPASTRRWPVWASAAALAAALVLGAITIGGFGHESHDIEAGRHAPTPTSVPFALAAGDGYTVTGGSAGNPDLLDTPNSLLLVGRGNSYTVDAYQPGDGDITTTGSLPVEVNGRRGYFGCLDMTSPPPYRNCSTPQLAWRYAPGAWAEVTAGRSKETMIGLLRVARSINFGRRTQLAFPLRIATAPRGARLLSWRLEYSPGTVTKDSTSVDVTYRYPTGERIEVLLFAGVPTNRNGRHEAVSSTGRRGFWSAAGPDLDLDVGHHLHVQIVESNVGKLKTVLTLRSALAFGAGVTVTPHLDDRDTWFPIETALPPG